jgi:hypothetical protein
VSNPHRLRVLWPPHMLLPLRLRFFSIILTPPPKPLYVAWRPMTCRVALVRCCYFCDVSSTVAESERFVFGTLEESLT